MVDRVVKYYQAFRAVIMSKTINYFHPIPYPVALSL